jgi:hypothetical protein
MQSLVEPLEPPEVSFFEPEDRRTKSFTALRVAASEETLIAAAAIRLPTRDRSGSVE